VAVCILIEDKYLLSLNITHQSGVAIVELSTKRLDASVAPLFKEQLLEIVRGGERRIVIDLSEVTFVDSSGLGAMVSVLKALGGQGALAVCGARSSVLELFRLTRMDKVFAIENNRQDAVDRLTDG
jgi:anti-sigma B factor antagonist